MATREDAKRHWQEISKRFKLDRGTRIAWTGDGQGTNASNFFWPPDNRYIWARESPRGDRPFPVLNRGRVAPAVNVPVILGYEDTAPEEQVLGIAREALPADISASRNWEIGGHHTQHEWDGGDEIFIDPRQFNYGLVHPTNPPSMSVKIKPFTYHYNGWNRFGGSTSVDFSGSTPAAGARYVLVSFDSGTNSVQYKGGASFANIDVGGAASVTTGVEGAPEPDYDHMPLGLILLGSATTAIRWDTELGDGRLHIDRNERPARAGDMPFSPDGIKWQQGIPLTEKTIGQQLIDEESGYLLFS